jgi:hypothetical protein
MWSCDQTAECIAERRLSELSAQEREALSEHLQACQACRAPVAEDRALEKVLSGFLKPVAAEADALHREESDTPTDIATATGRQAPSRSFRRALLRTLKWAAVLFLLVIGSMAATESGREQLARLAGLIEQWFVVEWSPRPGVGYSWSSNAPFDREAARHDLAEVDKLMLEGKGRLVGLIEGPDLTVYLVEYTLSDAKKMTMGMSRPTGLQAEAMHLEEIERLRGEGGGRLVSQRESPLGLGSFKIAFTLGSGEEIVLDTEYPPGPASDRERIFEEIRKQQKGGSGRILELNLDETGMLSGLVQYTLSDGRRVGLSQVFGHLEPGQRIPKGE